MLGAEKVLALAQLRGQCSNASGSHKHVHMCMCHYLALKAGAYTSEHDLPWIAGWAHEASRTKDPMGQLPIALLLPEPLDTSCSSDSLLSL